MERHKAEGRPTGGVLELRHVAEMAEPEDAPDKAGWPTTGMMDGCRGGKEEKYDHYLESKERHAKEGVNKHFHLNFAADAADELDESKVSGWPSPTANEPVDNVKIEHYRKTGQRFSPTGYNQPRGLMLEETVMAVTDETQVDKKSTLVVDPDLFPLRRSIRGRVGLLKGAGNAIVPPLAAIFIRSFMEATGLDKFFRNNKAEVSEKV